MIVANVIQQHADDAAALATSRRALTQAAYPRLPRLLRADRRLAAHLDGLRIAGDRAQSFIQATMETPSSGATFTSAIRLLERKEAARLNDLLALAEAVPQASDGLVYAFGWVERTQLHGIVSYLLNQLDGFGRMVGVAACAMHRVDPGIASGLLLNAGYPATRARAFRAIGELGLDEALPSCVAAARSDADEAVQFWAAWSAVLLGERKGALDLLMKRALAGSAHRVRAFRLALQAMTNSAAHSVLQQLAGNPQQTAWLIHGSGIVGDTEYVPWLIRHMKDVRTSRVAGEAFALITGADFPHEALDGPAPEKSESGPTDDLDDPNVDMDPDDGLPWPDVAMVKKWWTANESRFQKGTRYFMGKPVTREHCIDVLKNGYQRQRILAAHYLCLLEPGNPLFNTSAPAWRQQRLLAAM